MARYTIVIPTYNRPQLLIRAVVSALRACSPQDSVLVVDDRSVQPASEILRHIDDARLSVMINEQSQGASGARNYGVAHSQADVVFFLDDDDEILPDYCTRIMNLVDSGACCDYGFSAVKVHQLMPLESSVRKKKRLRTGIIDRTVRLKDRIAGTCEGFWIRKAVFEEIIGFDERLRIDEDTDLCCRLTATHKIAYYDEQPGVVVYREHTPPNEIGAQLTSNQQSHKSAEAYRITFEKNQNLFKTYSTSRWFLCARYLRRASKSQEVYEAWRVVHNLRPWPFRLLAASYLKIKLISVRYRYK